MDPPDITGLSLSSQRTPPRAASPALATPPAPTNATPGAGLQLDMTLGSAVQALVHHLVQPLAAHYSHSQLMTLRQRLTKILTKAYEPSWNESNPHQASGARSLISDRVHGLPPLLREAAGKDIDIPSWSKAISASHRKRAEGEDESEWEVWCDPGMVVWRWGGWGWDEPEFDPIRRPRESFHVIWQAAPTASSAPAESSPHVTPVRTSKAIPIRAPSLLAFPPTRSEGTRSPSPGLLSANNSPSRPSSTQQDGDLLRHSSRNVSFTRPSGHKGSDSTSSRSSDSSDTNSNSHTQLLTPASRPGSADLLPSDKNEQTSENEEEQAKRGRTTSPTQTRPSSANSNGPTVTPYDGGNVTVLGGGTKLGGSRPSSVYGSRLDRTRSPSVSIASRALGNAVGPNSNGGTAASAAAPRKQRTRRRIIPTHIGYFGQPGVGAPMMGAFGMNQPKPYSWPHGQPGGPSLGGVGVGVSPPPVNGMAIGIKRI